MNHATARASSNTPDSWSSYQHQEIEACKEAIRTQPEKPQNYYNLGAAYDRLGHVEEAIAAYTEAIRLKPDFAEAHFHLGALYGQLGRSGEEIEAYTEAVRIKPDFAEAHFNLGLSYLIVGDTHSAQAQCKILEALRLEEVEY
jgi:Flp pilus assembly protein TadD